MHPPLMVVQKDAVHPKTILKCPAFVWFRGFHNAIVQLGHFWGQVIFIEKDLGNGVKPLSLAVERSCDKQDDIIRMGLGIIGNRHARFPRVDPTFRKLEVDPGDGTPIRKVFGVTDATVVVSNVHAKFAVDFNRRIERIANHSAVLWATLDHSQLCPVSAIRRNGLAQRDLAAIIAGVKSVIPAFVFDEPRVFTAIFFLKLLRGGDYWLRLAVEDDAIQTFGIPSWELPCAVGCPR